MYAASDATPSDSNPYPTVTIGTLHPQDFIISFYLPEFHKRNKAAFHITPSTQLYPVEYPDSAYASFQYGENDSHLFVTDESHTGFLTLDTIHNATPSDSRRFMAGRFAFTAISSQGDRCA